MRSTAFIALLLTLSITASCLQPTDHPQTGQGRSALSGEPSLVVSGPIEPALPGSDQRPHLRVEWLDGRGERVPVASPHPIVNALPWQDAAIIVDSRRQMWRLWSDGRRERLGRDVIGTPVVSGDGELLAYVEVRDLLGEIRIRRPQAGPRVVGQGLQSAGALLFSPEGDRLFFVGSRPGGVAGLWTVSIESPASNARCLTNCALRAGRPWDGSFVPPPRSAADLHLDGDDVSWSVEGVGYIIGDALEDGP